MAERGSSSRKAVRMSIAFMNTANSSSVEAQTPDEIADNCTVAGDSLAGDHRELCPRQGSMRRGNSLRLRLAGADDASASQRTAVRLVSGSFQLAPQLPRLLTETALRASFDEAAPQPAPPAPTDVPEAGLTMAWPATHEDVQTPRGSLLVRHHTPTNRWVRFAWESLATGEEVRRGSSYSPAVTETHAVMPATGGGGGGAAGTIRTGVATLRNEFSEVSAPQRYRRLGAKRFRGSPEQGGQSLAEEHDGDSTRADGCHNFLTARISPDGRDRGRTPPGISTSPHSPRSKHARFAVDGATGQARQARGAQNPVGSSAMLSRTTRGLADVVAAAGRSSTRTMGHMPSFAAGGRQMNGCGPGGIVPQSRARGGASATTATTREDVPPRARAEGCMGEPAAVVTTAAAVAKYQDRHQHQYQQGQEQEHEHQSEGNGVGGTAKKARYRSLRVRKTLSAGHMDSLTVGVGSLGVATPGTTCTTGSGKWKPVDAPTSRSCARRRQTPTRSSRTVFLPDKTAHQRPSLGGGGASTAGKVDADAGAGAGAGAGVGAGSPPDARGRSSWTIRSREANPCATKRGRGHHEHKHSKKRQRDGFVRVLDPAFRSAQHLAETEAPGFDAAVSTASSPLTAAAGGVCGEEEGKGRAVAATADGSSGTEDDGGGGGDGVGDGDNSSDGDAAQEELSAWLHGTDDWWTS